MFLEPEKQAKARYWSLKMGITTKMHAVCASEKFALKIQFSAEKRQDAPEVRKLIELFNCKAGYHLLIDRAYEDDRT